MSMAACNWAWLQPLKSNTKLTLLRLADFAGEYGECFASYKRLTDDVCVCKNTIIKSLNELEEWGYITKIKNLRENHGFATNSFVLNMFTQDVVPPSSENEQGASAASEQGLVHTGEQGKEHTKELKKEKKKKRNPVGFDIDNATQQDWHEYLSTLAKEPYNPDHSHVCMCSPCRINKNWHKFQNKLKKENA